MLQFKLQVPAHVHLDVASLIGGQVGFHHLSPEACLTALDTKEGRFMFAVLAAAAEYELKLRAERQAEGIAAARRRQDQGTMLPGKNRIGRPRAVGPAELAQLQRMTGEGASVTQAARILKISRSTAYAALGQHATAATPL